jgi:lipoyl(octanoyl) transferase
MRYYLANKLIGRHLFTIMSLARDKIDLSLLPRPGSRPVTWRVLEGLAPYEETAARMEALAEAIAAGRAPEEVWLVEHPPLYTAGSSATDADLIEARFPVHKTGRGGRYTYHGPGQRVAYAMLNLSERRRDVRAFVCALEGWLIAALGDLGVRGERRGDRVGVWVARPDKPPGLGGEAAEDKIAALGVRLRHWVSFHGVALNVAPDLTHFSGIAPCGLRARHLGVTSLEDLGAPSDMKLVDARLRERFEAFFGPTAEG